MTLCALESLWTLVPTDAFSEDFAVLGCVFEDLGWASEVPHMVRIDAAFTVVAVLLGWAPSSLIHEHVKHESILIQVETLQVEVQVGAAKQTLGYKVVLNTFVLEVQVDLADRPKISQAEAGHLVGLPATIESNDQGAVEAVMTEELQLLSVVIACQCFLIRLHVENV